MSVQRRIPDLAPKGAEGRFMTQLGPSTRQRKRGAFYEPLDDFVARRTAAGGASPMD